MKEKSNFVIYTFLVIVAFIISLVLIFTLTDIDPEISTLPETGSFTPINALFISPNGSDLAGNGTSSNPYQTFKYAFDQASMNGNDGIIFKQGIYNEDIVINNYQENDFVISTESGALVLLEGNPDTNASIIELNGSTRNIHFYNSDPKTGRFIVDGSNKAFLSDIGVVNLNQVSNIEISNLEIMNSNESGINIKESIDISILDSKIHDIFKSGITANGANIELIRNEVFNTVLENKDQLLSFSCNGWGSAIRVDLWTNLDNPLTANRSSSDVTISDNTIYSNWGEGISTINPTKVNISDNNIFNNYSSNIKLNTTESVTIDSNYIYSNDSTFFKTCGSPQDADGILTNNSSVFDFHSSSRNIDIINNLISGTHTGIKYTQDSNSVNGLDTYQEIAIANNTIVYIDDTAIDFEFVPNINDKAKDSILENNILSKISGKQINLQNPEAWIVRHNFWDEQVPSNPGIALINPLAGDPEFIVPSSKIGDIPGYYQLKDTSLAIGNGYNSQIATLDYFDTSRLDVPNTIGFYQSSLLPTVVPPTATPIATVIPTNTPIITQAFTPTPIHQATPDQSQNNLSVTPSTILTTITPTPSLTTINNNTEENLDYGETTYTQAEEANVTTDPTISVPLLEVVNDSLDSEDSQSNSIIFLVALLATSGIVVIVTIIFILRKVFSIFDNVEDK